MRTNNSGNRATRGFTLIEVMVALAIASIALGALTKATYQSADVADKLSSKLLATWVASNAIAEMRIDQSSVLSGPESSESMGGREWRIDARSASTGDQSIARVDVTVTERESGALGATLFGFVMVPLKL